MELINNANKLYKDRTQFLEGLKPNNAVAKQLILTKTVQVTSLVMVYSQKWNKF